MLAEMGLSKCGQAGGEFQKLLPKPQVARLSSQSNPLYFKACEEKQRWSRSLSSTKPREHVSRAIYRLSRLCDVDKRFQS